MFGEASALGHVVTSSSHTYTVVGVVDDVRFATQREGTWGEGFTPLSRSERYYATYVLRAEDRLDEVLARVAQTISRDVPGVLVERAEPVAESVAGTVHVQRFQASLFGVAAAAALVLLAVGVAGVVATSVRRRWREAGIRSALGASRSDIVGMLIADHARPAAVGMTAGLLASWWAKGLLSRLLYNLEPSDLRVWALASSVILAVVLLSAWLPARRAAHAEPSLVLRAD
jgi:ABC-type antimicrobial peptide transport system permease subunit